MHLFINSLAASAGGGLTYIRNVLPFLAEDPRLRVTVALSSDLREEFRHYRNIDLLDVKAPVARRFWYEQSTLPEIIRRSGADVLLSTGNVALRRSPVPQILLSRNSIYLSKDFYRDLLARHEYRAWLDTHLRGFIARKSIAWADITVAPSEAFAAELQRWAGRQVLAIHHGFDPEGFRRTSIPFSPEVEEKLGAARDCVTLLFVSHYNYYRNFETLIRALPLLRDRLPNRSIKLLLTCSLSPGKNPGAYDPETAAQLAKKIGASDMIVELGSIPYHQLGQLYARASVYVTPAYTETFAHPLVEAMASGLPIVASDLAVHREICSDAAEYFPKFSAQDLAEALARVISLPETAKRMSAAGLQRSGDFSWKTHVERILELCTALLDPDGQKRPLEETVSNSHARSA
jgi:glycosyltransferase involved in cell wall biosynthesis